MTESQEDVRRGHQPGPDKSLLVEPKAALGEVLDHARRGRGADPVGDRRFPHTTDALVRQHLHEDGVPAAPTVTR